MSYLQSLHTRAYGPNTLYAMAGTIKKFVQLMPSARSSVLLADPARTDPCDLDSFITAARAEGLAPSTINNKLPLLREFFSFLIEEGEMERTPDYLAEAGRVHAADTKARRSDDVIRARRVLTEPIMS